nr:unnamed protein product [Digitaria exilis]
MAGDDEAKDARLLTMQAQVDGLTTDIQTMHERLDSAVTSSNERFDQIDLAQAATRNTLDAIMARLDGLTASITDLQRDYGGDSEPDGNRPPRARRIPPKARFSGGLNRDIQDILNFTNYDNITVRYQTTGYPKLRPKGEAQRHGGPRTAHHAGATEWGISVSFEGNPCPRTRISVPFEGTLRPRTKFRHDRPSLRGRDPRAGLKDSTPNAINTGHDRTLRFTTPRMGHRSPPTEPGTAVPRRQPLHDRASKKDLRGMTKRHATASTLERYPSKQRLANKKSAMLEGAIPARIVHGVGSTVHLATSIPSPALLVLHYYEQHETRCYAPLLDVRPHGRNQDKTPVTPSPPNTKRPPAQLLGSPNGLPAAQQLATPLPLLSSADDRFCLLQVQATDDKMERQAATEQRRSNGNGKEEPGPSRSFLGLLASKARAHRGRFCNYVNHPRDAEGTPSKDLNPMNTTPGSRQAIAANRDAEGTPSKDLYPMNTTPGSHADPAGLSITTITLQQ